MTKLFNLSLMIGLTSFSFYSYADGLYYLDLTTYHLTEYYKDTSSSNYQFSRFGEKANLSYVNLFDNKEITQSIFGDFYKTTYSKSNFYQAGYNLGVSENSSLVNREVSLTLITGEDGFNQNTSLLVPTFNEKFSYDQINLSTSHNQQLSALDSYSLQLSAQYFQRKSQGLDTDTLLSTTAQGSYSRQLGYNWDAQITLERQESIDQNDNINIILSGLLQNNNQISEFGRLSEQIGLSQQKSANNTVKNLIGGVTYTYTYGETLDDPEETVSKDGEKDDLLNLSQDEERGRLDKILNPVPPDVLTLSWLRQFSTFIVGSEKVLSDTFLASWLHALGSKSSLNLEAQHVAQIPENNSNNRSFRNTGTIRYNHSFKVLNYSFNRPPEQIFSVGLTRVNLGLNNFNSQQTTINAELRILL